VFCKSNSDVKIHSIVPRHLRDRTKVTVRFRLGLMLGLVLGQVLKVTSGDSCANPISPHGDCSDPEERCRKDSSNMQTAIFVGLRTDIYQNNTERY